MYVINVCTCNFYFPINVVIVECVTFVEQKLNIVYNHILIFYAFLSPNSVLCCKTLHSNRIVCVYCLKLTLLPQNIVRLVRYLQFGGSVSAAHWIRDGRRD